MNFWADAKQTQVTWAPADPRLEALIAGSRFPGLYALVADGCVLRSAWPASSTEAACAARWASA